MMERSAGVSIAPSHLVLILGQDQEMRSARTR
jgi:hypothetical protein